MFEGRGMRWGSADEVGQVGSETSLSTLCRDNGRVGAWDAGKQTTALSKQQSRIKAQ